MNYKEVPFDIELAKKHPESIFTRNGKEAKQVTFFEGVNTDYPILAVVEGVLRAFTKEGFYISGQIHSNDLVIRIPVEELEVTIYCYGYRATAFTSGEILRYPSYIATAEKDLAEGKATKTIIKVVKPFNSKYDSEPWGIRWKG